MATSAELLEHRFLKPYPPKAAQLIVTIYGDIVEPRGGVLWMGDLISLCAGFGVNESLVRTAVSRLVSKGQLAGKREGRRSFYALTAEASSEYHLAADLFFGPADGDCEWLLSHCPAPEKQLELQRAGFGHLGGDVYIGADRPDRRVSGTVFRSRAVQPEGVRSLIETVFSIRSLSVEYAEFVEQFLPMKDFLNDGVPGQTALLFRLALVHAYRTIRLRDPRLPPSALPADWAGGKAQDLFAALYKGLSGPADTYIGAHLLNQKGSLPANPEAVKARLKTLGTHLSN